MLSIGKLGIGQERYYLDKVAEGAEDYYAGEGEAEGQWLGDAAAELGLDGVVEADQLTAMLTGRNPATGEPLGLRAVGGRGAVPGFDLTFSVPKSASLVWALGDADTAAAITAATESSTRAALDYLQREACWTRRGADAEFVKGSGFLAAAFRHRSSRAGDPQVHIHTLIANATQGPDGKWTRLYHPAIYDHAKTAGYLFEAHFRADLTRRLGVGWQEVRNGIAEIEGFADDHLRTFSTRRQQILEAAGPEASARSKQVATLATRTAKEEGLTQETLRERWNSKAAEIGLEVERTLGHVRDSGAPDVARTASTWQVGRAVTTGVSHFDRRDAIQAVAGLARHGMDAAEVEGVADAFLASEEVVTLGASGKGERFTTREVWEIERAALAKVEKMQSAGGGSGASASLGAERVIAERPTLKADQAEMIRRLLTDPGRISVVIGEAGTGKTYAIVAAAQAWAREGVQSRAAAPTWRAANVMRAEGLTAQSTASLLAELDREGLERNSVLLVDEAGMVDSASIARLIDHAERAQAKLVLVGDYEQLSEIEAGGLFRAIAERGDPITLDEVIRHRFDVEREGAKRIREGEGEQAIRLYRSEERVIVAEDADQRREVMVNDWHQAQERGEDAVMIAKRNAEVDQLNELARAKMKAAGRLGAGEVEVGGRHFAAGDEVITRVNDRKAAVYNRERWQVVEVDATGRRVVLQGLDQARTVELGADYLAQVNPHSGAPALQHAYAITTYSAQGTTVERAYLAADASMDKQELYVATSRSRGETLIYATPEVRGDRAEIAPAEFADRSELAHLGEAAVRDRAQRAAHDVAKLDGLPTEELRRRQSELSGPAMRERANQECREALAERIAAAETRLADPGARGRLAASGLEKYRAERDSLPPIRDDARRELATVEEAIAAREQLTRTAARIAPPPYVAAELGQRPTNPTEAKAWDRGLTVIETYRRDNGVTDRASAFGPAAKGGAAKARQRKAMERTERVQRQLRDLRVRQRVRERAAERSFGISR
ncbi:MAG: MobF family relaxase [Solirubrobacterales bacterium]